MKKINLVVSVFFLLIIQINSLKAQEIPRIPINTVVERVQKYLGVYPVEKVHLHFDKPYYAVGDTLWFKTYLYTNQLEYQPSKIAYVDIVNGRDSLIQTLRLPLKNNGGEGFFVLDPQVIKQDNYRFRAYTKWMMNFNVDYLFNKIITVGDAINKKLGSEVSYVTDGNKTKATIQFRDSNGGLLSRKKLTWEAIDGWDPFDKGKGETDDMGRANISFSAKEKELFKKGRLIVKIDGETAMVGDFPLKNALTEYDMQFFPEGGDLLAGVEKRIAFKAIDSNGKSIRVKGKIVNAKKSSIIEFEDLGLGMGYVNFTPIAGETYKAVVTIDGKERTYDLPPVKAEGINLTLKALTAEATQLEIITNDTYLSKIQAQPFYIFGQMNGNLIYGAQISIKNASSVINVPIAELPSGVVQFTLMTAQGKAISERLVFNEFGERLNLQVKTDKSAYQRKDKVVLDLTNLTREKVATNLSISVIDEAKVPFDELQENTIISNLLLTSDLAGFVEKPNYYFDEKVANRKDALDALLMTQGFRRFSYDDLVAEKYPKINFLPEQGIVLSGTLRLNTGRTYPNGGLLLSIPARGFKKDTYTDNNGRFLFENLNFPDSVKVTINARSNDNFRNIVINMDQSFFPSIDENNPYKANDILNIDKEMSSYLANSKNEFRTSILIDEVTVTATRKEQRTSKEFSSLSGLSMADHRIEGERLNGCNVLTMCLNTMLTGVTYDSNTLKYYLTRGYNQGSRVPVQFFLNGMPIDENTLNSIVPTEIEAIEIFTRDDLGTVSRLYQNDGVVSIITKKEKPKGPRMTLAQIEAMLPKSNVIDLFPLGYIKERKFYAPKYETDQQKATNDYRTTIYWNPTVELDENGKAVLEFYNADGNGKYKVVVEGMDNAGRIGRTVFNYQVN
ncbi:alpha-2-macroglobulin family protein [Sphingobacterium bovistauri]|uniref:Carboxypeptidase regulatory-like domain-containing protein n=1 Tax=Sphingobacterium bovistauri TaxID=2781959 RepID=A0ABS7Z7N3_9SPHI|nr:carboxypeptidase regulatory-like domain-containing protein [Sphingobacterium bovistauri]MCA5005426.1 carboxypeptidase regulatory-like domain-containing protein [Sphingobacterium bovistauri]